MIDARPKNSEEVSYVEAKYIDINDLKIDSAGFITFYNSNDHQYYTSVMPWTQGLDEFRHFVLEETNLSEIEQAS